MFYLGTEELYTQLGIRQRHYFKFTIMLKKIICKTIRISVNELKCKYSYDFFKPKI